MKNKGIEDAKSGIEAVYAGKVDCAAIGDVVNYNMTDYNLTAFSNILAICD